MKDIIVVFGAPDPEAATAENLAYEAGCRVYYAAVNGQQVHPGNAYRATGIIRPAGQDIAPFTGLETLILFECDGSFSQPGAIKVDHHRPGDVGFGRPPAEYWEASSIGQLWLILRAMRILPEWRKEADEIHRLKIIAAADHCLRAAYAGECPGVEPDDLLAFRAASRAAFQRRSPEEVQADVEATTEALRMGPLEYLGNGYTARDMRRDPPWPELPEAAARLGESYIAGPIPDRSGRAKITCSGVPAVVRVFMDEWAPGEGLQDIYGDPARGFAGGYLP